MTEFWLVRHGQTDWNLEGRFQGGRDIALNLNGKDQASRIAKRLQEVQFEAIYSSPLLRARHTAERIAEMNENHPEIQLDDRLVEVDLGEWEGMLFEDIQRQNPSEFEMRKTDPLHARPPGGETALEVATRIAGAADEIANRHPQGRVLLVSHGLTMAAFICLAQDIPLENVYSMIPENAEPVVVEWVPGKNKQYG
jgi:broad specificity phosphatase PhoE